MKKQIKQKAPKKEKPNDLDFSDLENFNKERLKDYYEEVKKEIRPNGN